MINVPEGWQSVTVGAVCDLFSGVGFPTRLQGQKNGEVPFFKVGDISNAWRDGSFLLRQAQHYITQDATRELKARLLPENSVVFAKIGEAISLNRRAVLGQPSLIDNNCMALTASAETVVPQFLFHYVCTLRFGESSRASVVPSLRRSDVADQPMPLPPLAEQRRIVAKIEELFSDLDAGVAALERVRVKLKRYRASVLNAAVTGKLTEAWRQQHPPAEPADKLLARILDERRKQWEAEQLRKFSEAGKKPPKGWQERYHKAVEPDHPALESLPSGWQWLSMDSLIVAGPQNGAYYPKASYGAGIGIFRIDDYQNTHSRPASELRQVAAPPGDVQGYGLRVRDVLINRVNSMTHLGKCLLVEERHVPAVFESNMMRLTLADSVSAAFVALYLKSHVGRARLTANAKWAVNQASINQTDVASTPVPLPLLAEQAEIVAEVERRLSVVDAVEAEVNHGLKRAVRLRQAILKRAFEGKLVPQDPTDEPASALLVTIGREAEQPTQRRGKTAARA